MSTRVLHVSQPVEAGVPVVVSQLVRDQVDRGWDVGVACPPDGSLPQWVRAAGGRVLPWPARRSPGPSVMSEVAALRRIVAEFSPDVVHLHSSKAGLVGRLAIRGRRATVYQPHAWSFLAVTGAVRALSIRWERWATRWADAIACVSRAEQETAQQKSIAGNWVLCPNGIDLRTFRPSSPDQRRTARTLLDLADHPVVLCVGRLCEQKGQDVLIDAWARMGRDGAVLAFVGDGPSRDSLQGRAGADVIFAGHVTDLRPWYAAASLAVLPSRWEGASLTTREAMACGLSQVVTDVDGAREAIGSCGAIVPVDDVDALAAAIGARLDDDDLRTREGEQARRVAEQSFDLSHTVRVVAAIYEAVLLDRQ
jgi:glycosyltransferase involved in cell wall biosynthesis